MQRSIWKKRDLVRSKALAYPRAQEIISDFEGENYHQIGRLSMKEVVFPDMEYTMLWQGNFILGSRER